jgi:SAM-dependent methyltransferase
MRDRISLHHFNAIADSYAGFAGTLEPLYDAVRAELDQRVAGKAVLDVGNGGIFPYDRTLAASVSVLDISPEMLRRVPSEGVVKIVSDARNMATCADESFDTVIFNLSLHHIAADTLAATAAGLRDALSESFRTLRPGGDLIVYEPVLGSALFSLERVLFRPIRGILKLAGVPMVFFQSRASLRRLLAEACGLEHTDIAVTSARVSGWSDPLGGTFPGLVLLPVALYPTRFELFRASKPRG